MIMYKFVEERLSEDRVNFIGDKPRKEKDLAKAVKADLGRAIYPRPKNLKSKFLPKGKG